ncbi:MAG: hypothetical protein JO324_06115 [Candidatus Eremiobacteraeota bacterium]|nr:hypothetical protein [Candidatus Eremiobacteraeota bacterium]
MATVGTSGQDLLYIGLPGVSRGYIYSYPQGERIERFSEGGGWQQGACADTSGNVYFIVLYPSGGYSLAVFQHGGTKPTDFVTRWGPTCSFDPTSGDLAVGPAGKVAIYRTVPGKPKLFSVPSNFHGIACTYDNSGNLFIDGYTSGSVPALAELRKGGTSFVSIALPPKMSGHGLDAMRWDGKYLSVTNGAATIYRLAVTGKKARVAGTVQLQGLSGISSIWIQSDTIVAGGYPLRHVFIWNYPAGGSPIKTIRNVGKGSFVAVSAPGT